MSTKQKMMKHASLYLAVASALALTPPLMSHGAEVKATLESPFEGSFESGIGLIPVSYTHLTLPTTILV